MCSNHNKIYKVFKEKLIIKIIAHIINQQITNINKILIISKYLIKTNYPSTRLFNRWAFLVLAMNFGFNSF